jgi:hypothetical protein
LHYTTPAIHTSTSRNHITTEGGCLEGTPSISHGQFDWQ